MELAVKRVVHLLGREGPKFCDSWEFIESGASPSGDELKLDDPLLPPKAEPPPNDPGDHKFEPPRELPNPSWNSAGGATERSPEFCGITNSSIGVFSAGALFVDDEANSLNL